MLPPPSPVDPDTKPRTPVAVSRCRVLGDLEVLVAWHIIRSRRIAGFQRVLAESSREVTKVSRGLPRRCRCFLLGGRTGTGEDQRATDLVAVGLVSRDDADGGSRWFFFDRGPATKKKKCPAHAGMNGHGRGTKRDHLLSTLPVISDTKPRTRPVAPGSSVEDRASVLDAALPAAVARMGVGGRRLDGSGR